MKLIDICLQHLHAVIFPILPLLATYYNPHQENMIEKDGDNSQAETSNKTMKV